MGIMYSMTYRTFEVGTAEFREQVSSPKLTQLLADHPVVAVGRYKDEPDAIVVEPSMFTTLAASQEQLEELRALVPLLLAALSAGAPAPAPVLERLGVQLPEESWDRLAETLEDLRLAELVRSRLAIDGGTRIPMATLDAEDGVDLTELDARADELARSLGLR